MSPSAWREWIEIRIGQRNIVITLSPSAWREWIEITNADTLTLTVAGLPPHGGSGLK